MRLKEDNDSWRAGGIKRRMYRQAPLTPEEETPRRGYTSKKYKKKHVHEFETKLVGTKTAYTYSWNGTTYDRIPYEVGDWRHCCVRCGFKRRW